MFFVFFQVWTADLQVLRQMAYQLPLCPPLLKEWNDCLSTKNCYIQVDRVANSLTPYTCNRLDVWTGPLACLSLLRYLLDKLRCIGPETYLNPILFSQIIIEWMFQLWERFWGQYSLLLEKLVTNMGMQILLSVKFPTSLLASLARRYLWHLKVKKIQFAKQ